MHTHMFYAWYWVIKHSVDDNRFRTSLWSASSSSSSPFSPPLVFSSSTFLNLIGNTYNVSNNTRRNKSKQYKKESKEAKFDRDLVVVCILLFLSISCLISIKRSVLCVDYIKCIPKNALNMSTRAREKSTFFFFYSAPPEKKNRVICINQKRRIVCFDVACVRQSKREIQCTRKYNKASRVEASTWQRQISPRASHRIVRQI